MTTTKVDKHVLVGDDEEAWHDRLRHRFDVASADSCCPYRFQVETAGSGEECLTKIRGRQVPYDVLILDIRMERELSGIHTARVVDQEFRGARPVIVVFTGFPKYETCVEAMRNGAWDYIVKESTGDRTATEAVLDSVVERLRELDLQQVLQTQIAEDWLPNNEWQLRHDYPNRVVAIWHEPEIHVVGWGLDAFELEKGLSGWRKEHERWQSPFFVKIPPLDVAVGG